MKCPKCGTTLVKKFYKGMMEVECCPNCRGMWLDFDELDRLEDVVFDLDQYKGSLVHREMETNYFCPHCESHLQEFQYRLYDLKLDTCENVRKRSWFLVGCRGRRARDGHHGHTRCGSSAQGRCRVRMAGDS